MTVVCTALLVLIWTQIIHLTLEYHHHTARVKLKYQEHCRTLSLPDSGNVGWKLVKYPNNANIYAGSPQSLYTFNSDSDLKEVSVPIFKTECKDMSTGCPYSIQVLTEGKNGHPLFICGKHVEAEIKCCRVNSMHNPVDCFQTSNDVSINNISLYTVGDVSAWRPAILTCAPGNTGPCASLLGCPSQFAQNTNYPVVSFTTLGTQGNSLFYTISGTKIDSMGLFKVNNYTFTWPSQPLHVQSYVKIITNERDEGLDGKLYTFYSEENINKDPEVPLWIPRIAQYCMADTGGTKNCLQYRWISMLTARLFCGDKEKRNSFTQLLDVAVLEAENWNNTMIYALFKNEYNITAVCAYQMSEIIRIFTSSKFRGIDKDHVQQKAGECVSHSEKTMDFLMFVEKRLEMEEWIEPKQGPLLVSHHHYTHLQVDKVKSYNQTHHVVLIMSLDNGKIHKVLEQDGFIIAEYQPFNSRTYIHNMLLDRSAKNLYVSSNSEVVQISLQNCSHYKTNCESCVMARDPYCSWGGTQCSATAEFTVQDVSNGNSAVCESHPRTSPIKTLGLTIRHGSRHFLQCSSESQHATYTWYHDGKKKDCFSNQQGCILLIEHMSNSHDGFYVCIASENGQNRTITSYHLKSSAFHLSVAPVMLVWLLLLIYLI